MRHVPTNKMPRRHNADPPSSLKRFNQQCFAHTDSQQDLSVGLTHETFSSLREWCYNLTIDRPSRLSLLVCTSSMLVPLKLHLHELIAVYIPDHDARERGAAVKSKISSAERWSQAFARFRSLPCRIAGISPLRDRLGKQVHRAVVLVDL